MNFRCNVQSLSWRLKWKITHCLKKYLAKIVFVSSFRKSSRKISRKFHSPITNEVNSNWKVRWIAQTSNATEKAVKTNCLNFWSASSVPEHPNSWRETFKTLQAYKLQFLSAIFQTRRYFFYFERQAWTAGFLHESFCLETLLQIFLTIARGKRGGRERMPNVCLHLEMFNELHWKWNV